MASSEVKAMEYEAYQTQTQRLLAKAKAAPYVPLGISGMVGMLGWGVYKYRHRGDMSTSIFLMHLRVKAQGMVVGAIALGAAYTLAKDYIWDKEGHQKELEQMNSKH